MRHVDRPTFSYDSNGLDGGDLVVLLPVGIDITSASSAAHYKTCDRPDLVPEGAPVRVGNQDIHHTHSIGQNKSLVHCNRCLTISVQMSLLAVSQSCSSIKLSSYAGYCI